MRNFKIEFDARDKEQLETKLKVIEYDVKYLNEKCGAGDIKMAWIGNQYVIHEPPLREKPNG